MTSNRIAALAEVGQSVWIDFISREALSSGELAGFIKDGVVGLTSNPSIFEKAMAAGSAYDDDIRRLVVEGKNAGQVYEALALADIAAAADLLHPVYELSAGLDGYASIEVSPHLAHDTGGTIAEARRLWAALNRPNIFIKVPGSPAGVPAIRELIAEGINVNVTLLFSIEAYEATALAYIEGLEARAAADQDVNGIASVASFFVSRVDTMVDKQLAGKPRLAELRGKAGIANAKLAYVRFQQLFSGPRWEKLARRGARVQRPLWASTSTKDPTFPDTMYVDGLIGPDTVNTMPAPTVEAFLDHGTVAVTLTQDIDAARRTLAALEANGIHIDAVTDTLLADGIRLFTEAFDRLEARLTQKSETLVRA